MMHRDSRRQPFYVTLAMGVLVSLLVYLGFWQLHRGQHKLQKYHQFQNQSTMPALFWQKDCLITPENYALHRYRKLRVTGTLLNEKSIFIDNYIYKRQVGYRLLTPLVTVDQKLLLIDRGWMPKEVSLKSLPFITQEITLEGFINRLTYGLRLKKADERGEITWPYHTDRIDWQTLSSQFHIPILSFVLQLQLEPPAFPYRHFGYALQWFFFALLCLIYYGIYMKKSVFEREKIL